MKYLIPILNKKQKRQLGMLLALWAALNAYFLFWWFQPGHIVNLWLYALNTIVVVWSYLLPAYLFFFIIRMQKPNPKISIPDGWKVAMVVTKAPSESYKLVIRTLEAMLEQGYPHDTWIADEDPTLEIYKWAMAHNVSISTRKGIAEYNKPSWPRRAKSKEGNLAYFYDKYGYKNYDFVVQLDADHVAQAHYLENMLRPFVNPEVGYVSAPSICGNNADKSWIARARLYAESALHGPQQAGHTNGFSPLCFGSHYAIRTTALREIGGLGPELAEDHSTSMIMNAFGWKGVHSIDAMALGDGPETFMDAMVQEFQWARSLMNIFLMWLPKYFGRLSTRLKFQFLFSQLWYALYSTMILVGLLIPLVAIMFDTPTVAVSYMVYLTFNILNIFVTISLMSAVKKLKVLRPVDAKIISWEIVLFQIARWPWIFWGLICSVTDYVRKQEFAFKVTSKNKTGYKPLQFKFIMPYVAVLATYLAVGILWPSAQRVSGYYYLVITGLIMYLITLTTIVFLHEYEQKK